MKKLCLAVSILAASTSAAWAQSSVTLYGIVDGAVRYTTNSGPATNKGASMSQMVGGGMSQSRLGVNVVEDMGDGLKAIAILETRIGSDNGSAAGQNAANGSVDFWRLSYVGLQSNTFGRITLGRQYNILFDAYTSTSASFKYSPYIDVFKPELGMALTARQDNMIKYVAESGGLRFEAQVSAGENNNVTAPSAASPTTANTTGRAGQGKTMGGMLRYAVGGFAGTGTWLQGQDQAGKKVTVAALGGSWTDGPLYVNLNWVENKFESGFNAVENTALLGSIAGAISSKVAGGVVAASKREMFMAGVTYQVTPMLNLGIQGWHGRNYGLIKAQGEGTFSAFAVVADYALSKRTDAYVELDNYKVKGNLALSNGAGSRTGYMAGVRHRF